MGSLRAAVHRRAGGHGGGVAGGQPGDVGEPLRRLHVADEGVGHLHGALAAEQAAAGLVADRDVDLTRAPGLELAIGAHWLPF